MSRARSRWLVLAALGAIAAALLARPAVGLKLLADQRALAADSTARSVDGPLPRAANVRLRVVFHGDSRAAAWPAPRGVTGAEFLNRGVGGEPSARTRERFARDVAPLRPDVVVVQTCVNQLKLASMLPWLAERFVDQCLEDLESVIAQAREIEARVVLTTVFPVHDAPFPYSWFYPSGLRAVIVRANQRIRALEAPNLTLLDVTPPLSGADGTIQRQYAADWLHLSPAGYALLNQRLVPLLLDR